MFSIRYRDGSARAGTLKLSSGKIKTPFFMPVATKGSVKHLDTVRLKKTGAQCLISNSLISYFRPGLEMIRKAGGIHKFIRWDGGVFTDSGGFQSLDDNLLQYTKDEGAFFRDPFSGNIEKITPEKAMEIQAEIGSDVAMCLDEVPLHDDSPRTIRSKTLRTHSWARRCKKHHDSLGTGQLLFGIAQGGNDIAMRKKSIEFISDLGFDGIAQGGLAIGEPVSKMYATLRETCPIMPEDKVRYLMGVGNPADIVEAVWYGTDCFDSTFPTQNARHGTLFTMSGKLRLSRQEYAFDQSPVEEGCDCFSCRNYSRSYIRHLLKENEGVGMQLATIHNLRFMQRLMHRIRKEIKDENFKDFRDEFRKIY